MGRISSYERPQSTILGLLWDEYRRSGLTQAQLVMDADVRNPDGTPTDNPGQVLRDCFDRQHRIHTKLADYVLARSVCAADPALRLRSAVIAMGGTPALADSVVREVETAVGAASRTVGRVQTVAPPAASDGGGVMMGKELKAKRKALGLTQVQMAKLLHTTWNTIARWERGVRHPRTDFPLRQYIASLTKSDPVVMAVVNQRGK
jgi:DNA-binding XRE family transcriptional regulator